MTEIEQLRADLEVLERYFCDGCARVVQDKIARLEAAEADPWWEAKTMIEGWRKDILSGRHISPAGENAVHLFDHLSAEVARLTKRVAELEKARDIVRRLAEPDNLSLSEIDSVIWDATILWNEMLKGAGDE